MVVQIHPIKDLPGAPPSCGPWSSCWGLQSPPSSTFSSLCVGDNILDITKGGFLRPAPRSLSSLLACLRKTTVTISRCSYRCFVDRISHQPPSSPYSTCIYYWCEPREAVLELQPSFPGRGGGDACWNKISWAIFSEPKYFWTELYLKNAKKKV